MFACTAVHDGREVSLVHLYGKLLQRALNLRFGFGDYARTITVTSTNTSDLTDYAVPFTFDHASLVSAGKMQRDLRDLRIVDPVTFDVLPYWVERGIMTSSCKVWVKVPLIPASSQKTLLMIYGNPSLPPMSSASSVFIRGAGFDYGLDPGFTTGVYGTAPAPRFYMGFVEQCGYITNTSTSNIVASGLSPTTYPVLIVVRGMPAFSSVSGNVHMLRLNVGWFDAQSRVYFVYFRGDGTAVIERWSSSEGSVILTSASYYRGLPHEVRMLIDPAAKNIKVTVYDEARGAYVFSDYTIAFSTWNLFEATVQLANYSGSAAYAGHVVDYIYIRKRISPEPTASVSGSEL